jgi:hypothetical protein
VTLLPRRRQVRRVLPWRPGAPLRRRAMVRQHPCLGARLRVRPGRTRALPPPQRTAATSGANTATTSAHPASRSSTGTTPRSSLHSSPRTASTSLVPHLIAAMDFAGFQCFDPDFALGDGDRGSRAHPPANGTREQRRTMLFSRLTARCRPPHQFGTSAAAYHASSMAALGEPASGSVLPDKLYRGSDTYVCNSTAVGELLSDLRSRVSQV